MTPSLFEIENALGQHLAATPDIPAIAWPDGYLDAIRPLLIFQHNPFGVSDNTLDSTFPEWRGQVLITVLTDRNDMARQSRQLADTVMGRYPKGLRLNAGAGFSVLVTKPPEPRTGFPDGSDWRLPIVIDYMTEVRP